MKKLSDTEYKRMLMLIEELAKTASNLKEKYLQKCMEFDKVKIK